MESRRKANHLSPTRAQLGLCGKLPPLPTNALMADVLFSYLPLKKGRIRKSRLSFSMTVEKEFYTNPHARTYPFTQRNDAFVQTQQHFISPFYVRRAIRRYLQLQCTNKQLIYVYDSSFTAGLAYKAQYIARVNDLQQLYVNQRPS